MKYIITSNVAKDGQPYYIYTSDSSVLTMGLVELYIFKAIVESKLI